MNKVREITVGSNEEQTSNIIVKWNGAELISALISRWVTYKDPNRKPSVFCTCECPNEEWTPLISTKNYIQKKLLKFFE